MSKRHFLTSLLVLLFLSTVVSGQDLENIKKQKPLTISGSIGGSYIATITNDSNRVPMPNFWNANLNLNVSVFGVVVPLSAVITNGSFDFNNSFNQFGLSPKYKWITMHGGYRQYNYSPFSVSGQTFLGAGIELRPKWLRFGFFTGRLRKATIIDTSLYSQTIPGSYPLNVSSMNGTNYYSQAASFSRWGWGAKLGFGKESNFVDFVFFKAGDLSGSISDTVTLKKILPEKNVVFGINSYQKIGKRLTFGCDAAVSAYTYNTFADTIPFDDSTPLFELLHKTIGYNITTQLQWAGSINAGYTYKNFSLQSQYKRIEPYYKSMGTGSTYSDVELLSLQPSWSMLKKKLRVSNMFQVQRDNLNKYKLLTSNRMLVNTTISINPSNKWGADFSYNKFDMKQTKTNPLVSDSISVKQNSNTFSLIPRYIITSQKYNDIISLVLSYTDMKNGSLINKNAGNLKNLYLTLNNALTIVESGWSIVSGLNYNSAKALQSTLKSFGIIAGASKSVLKNTLSLSSNNTLLWNFMDGKSNGNTFSVDLNATYILLKKHSIGLGCNYVYSPANGIYNISDFNQTRIMVSYQYNF